MRRPTLVGMLIAGALTGCTAGSTLEEFDVARGPAGATATIFFRSDTRAVAELLEVSDSGMVVLSEQRVATISLDRVSRIRVHDYRTYTRPFRSSERGELRLVSRFPYGVPATALDSLLARAGQDRPAVLP